MKKLLVALLVFALVVPTAAASGPPPQGPPPPRGGMPPVAPKELADIPALDLADMPVLEELAGMELGSEFEKRDKGHQLVRSLSDEQRASIGQLLADNPLPMLGKVGDPVQPIQSADELRRHAEAMKALLPEMNRWKDTMSAGLTGILTPEQYALYQDSLLPPPVQMADIEPQAESDCYYAYYYAYYGVQYAYYFYLYAYYSYADGEHLISYDLYNLAYSAYLYDYYAYVYAYYAYVNYCNATYGYYAWYFSLSNFVVAYYGFNLAYEIYYMTGGEYAYYAYLYGYYTYVYFYYATYYAYYCYAEPCPNNPPYEPSNPSPPDCTTGVSIHADLSWTGGDPDGDSVTYDVYFEANDSTPDNLICDDVPTPTCDPPLDYETHYYWYVVATDEHGASTTGDTWHFETEPRLSCPGIPNGDFEQGRVVWKEYSSHGWPLILRCAEMPVDCHDGQWAVWLGGDYDESCYIQQTVTVPSGCPYLRYYHWIASQDSCGHDDVKVKINGSTVKKYDLCASNNTGRWVKGTVNLSSYAGQTVSLKFRVKTDGSLNSNWFLDDVAWAASAGAEPAPAIGVTDPAIAAPRPGASEPSGQGDKPPVKAPPIEPPPPPGASPP